MDATPLLKYISKYVTLSNEEVDFLLSKITYRKYLRGQYIIQQGDICRIECFVTSGCAKTFTIDENGQEHILLFSIEDWWIVDLESFTNQTPATQNVQCLEDTEVLQIHQSNIEEIFEQIPKMERFFRKIVERAYIAFQKRVMRNFSLNGKEKYLAFQQLYPKIEKRVPQYLIASYLGITKEFLSKIKSQLASK